ncbi:peptidylprolyl isomerase [Desulfococcaceae bacterium HSG8]|nr:peptidylprolyl isomerase [Desulfococcaceae bacterium HSG8]
MIINFEKCFRTMVIFFTLVCIALPGWAEETPPADKKQPADNKKTSTDADKDGPRSGQDKAAASEDKTSADKAGKTEENRIALVNGKAIYREDFDREMKIVRLRVSMQGQEVDEAWISEIKQNILDGLINRELLYQESQVKGIKLEDAAINDEFKKWKGQFPDESQFKNMMQMMDISEEIIKSQIRQQMTIRQFIDKQFDTTVTVSEDEVKKYYDTNPDLFKQLEQLHARHILIKADHEKGDAGKKKSRKKLLSVKEKLDKGEDFAELARKFSEGPSKEKGGDLGYFGRGQMVKPFEDAAFALEPGEVSDIVETQFGYHLIKVEEKKPEIIANYKDVREEIEKHLKQEKKMKEAALFGEKLKQKAQIETFLK